MLIIFLRLLISFRNCRLFSPKLHFLFNILYLLDEATFFF